MYDLPLTANERVFLAALKCALDQCADRDFDHAPGKWFIAEANAVAGNIPAFYESKLARVRKHLSRAARLAIRCDAGSNSAYEALLDVVFDAAREVAPDVFYLGGSNPGPDDFEEALAEFREARKVHPVPAST